MKMNVFVLTVCENDFNDVSAFSTEEKAINAIITDIKDRNHFGENEQSDEMVMELIEEMKEAIDSDGFWVDDEYVTYAIDKCELN
jgi:anti-sigma28 factor (negative regulator of flagellin synthesis)